MSGALYLGGVMTVIEKVNRGRNRNKPSITILYLACPETDGQRDGSWTQTRHYTHSAGVPHNFVSLVYKF